MPIPTLENKNHFKQYLRYFRNKFDNQIQQIELSYLEAMMSTRDQTIPSNTNINLVLFDNKEVVDLSTPLNNNEYLYFPAVEGDEIRILFENEVYTVGFSPGFVSLKFNGTNYSLNQSFTIGSKVLKVKGLGGGLVEVLNAPTYTLTQDTTSVDEGQTVTFTVTTTDVDDGTALVYTIVGGEDFNSEDINTGSLSGQVIVSNNVATIPITLRSDYSSSEIQEYFNLRVDTLSGDTVATSPTTFVNDTSNAVYAIGVNSTYDEGDTVTIIVSTTGIPDGVTLYWDIPQTTLDTYDISSLSGTVTINQGIGSFDVVAKQDFNVETDETFVVNFRVTGSNGTIVATSSIVNITDTPFTITLVPDRTTIVESTKDSQSDLNVTVTTSGATNGTLLYPGTSAIGGSFNTSDTSFPSSVAVNNDDASFNVNITRDGITEGTEIFVVVVKNEAGETLATSPNINITDASFIGSRITGMTYGAIRVNRDSGVVQNTSDWYTICNLDQAPDDAKIAIFIDQSGSMTMGTIQASYDMLVEKLQQRSIEFIVTTNSNEDWITPFDTSLDD